MLQICSYVEQLTGIQEVQPELMKVVLGGSAHETATLRVDDYMAYYRAAKQRFTETVLGTDVARLPRRPTHPEQPTRSLSSIATCADGRSCARFDGARTTTSPWWPALRAAAQALAARELDTVVRLAAAPIPFDPPLDGTTPRASARARAGSHPGGGPRHAEAIHELLLPVAGGPIEAERGLATLPSPTPVTCFWTSRRPVRIRGRRRLPVRGDGHRRGVRAFWSFDPDGSGDVTRRREAAFEQLMDFLTERLERHPEMHVYHYASYEPTALNADGRHGTREEHVDRLRGGASWSTCSGRAPGPARSVESYSIKKIEALTTSPPGRPEGCRLEHRRVRGVAPARDRSAVVVHPRLDRDLQPRRRHQHAALRDWLELQRLALAGRRHRRSLGLLPAHRTAPEQLREADARVQEVAARLTDGVPDDPLERTPEQQAAWLLAQLQSWHRREAKVAFWDFFNRLGMDVAELAADKQALGPLELVGRSATHGSHRLGPGTRARRGAIATRPRTTTSVPSSTTRRSIGSSPTRNGASGRWGGGSGRR